MTELEIISIAHIWRDFVELILIFDIYDIWSTIKIQIWKISKHIVKGKKTNNRIADIMLTASHCLLNDQIKTSQNCETALTSQFGPLYSSWSWSLGLGSHFGVPSLLLAQSFPVFVMVVFIVVVLFVSSDRSSCSDDGLLYIRAHFFRFSLSPLMQLMLQVSL